MGWLQTVYLNQRYVNPEIAKLSPEIPGTIYVFYDDSFLISFYVYVSLFYDAFFFYHKAYSEMFFY